MYCHTVHGSGWVRSKFLDVELWPSYFVINDELDRTTNVRLRTSPNDESSTVFVHPGDIIFATSSEDDWLKVLVDGVQYWLRREVPGSNTTLAVPCVPILYSKNPNLPYGCSLRIRGGPSDSAEVLRLTTSEYFLVVDVMADVGNKATWLRTIESPTLSAKAPNEWMQAISKDNSPILVPFDGLQSVCMNPSLPDSASLRVRSDPSLEGQEIDQILPGDIMPVTEIFEDNWANVFAYGLNGFTLSANDSMQLLTPLSPSGPSTSRDTVQSKFVFL
jgi:hypothetical protein